MSQKGKLKKYAVSNVKLPVLTIDDQISTRSNKKKKKKKKKVGNFYKEPRIGGKFRVFIKKKKKERKRKKEKERKKVTHQCA